MSMKLGMMQIETKSDINTINASQIKMFGKLASAEVDLENLQSDARKFSDEIEILQNDTIDVTNSLSQNTLNVLAQNQEVQV